MKKLLSIITACFLVLSLCSCSVIESFKNAMNGSETQTGAESSTENDDSEITNDITVGVTGLDEYNPLTTESESVRDICGFIFEPLFGLDESGRTVSMLAASYTVANNGKSITINLRQGVTWHDGTEFSSRDVLYTINMIRGGGTNYDKFAEPIAGASATDSSTVVISFSRPVPCAAALLTFPILKSGTAGIVGTGPFYYDGGKLTAYEGYYGGRAKIDTINIMEIPDREKYLSLFNASVIAFAGSDMLDMTSYMPKGNAKVYDYVSNDMVFAGFNTKSPVFSDKPARQAVSQIIDRDRIEKRIYYSRAQASEIALNPASWMELETKSKLKSNDAGVQDALKGGGWTADENGTYKKETEGRLIYFSVNIIVNSESDERVKIAEEICGKMNTAGMKTAVIKCTPEQFDYRVQTGDYDMFIGQTELMPNNDITPLVSSDGNSFGYSDETVDTILSQLSALQYDEEVQAVCRELYNKIAEDVPFAPICFMKKSIVTIAKIKDGVQPSMEALVRDTHNWRVK
ncbi:MAG: hypothetical protein J1G06_04780 [Oscillospiraceae bacterium]|nr:hypothetical protein [Oscillospiraceae bacterium]